MGEHANSVGKLITLSAVHSNMMYLVHFNLLLRRERRKEREVERNEKPRCTLVTGDGYVVFKDDGCRKCVMNLSDFKGERVSKKKYDSKNKAVFMNGRRGPRPKQHSARLLHAVW